MDTIGIMQYMTARLATSQLRSQSKALSSTSKPVTSSESTASTVIGSLGHSLTRNLLIYKALEKRHTQYLVRELTGIVSGHCKQKYDHPMLRQMFGYTLLASLVQKYGEWNFSEFSQFCKRDSIQESQDTCYSIYLKAGLEHIFINLTERRQAKWYNNTLWNSVQHLLTTPIVVFHHNPRLWMDITTNPQNPLSQCLKFTPCVPKVIRLSWSSRQAQAVVEHSKSGIFAANCIKSASIQNETREENW